MGAFLSDLIIVIIVAGLVTAASLYIYKEKKKGRHCIGCPMAGKCPKHHACANLKATCTDAQHKTVNINK
ncbi:MAG: FeoB-associated Cys-rich membrane protein [Lachnospiraceae bacterium]|nr:FeoB-associated Cys-rich membrane protein [Lachnospiraceae bacterium]